MKIYEYTENDIDIDFSVISSNPEDILFFDIETTGLSPERSDLYLIGCGTYNGSAWKVTLIFNDDDRSEPEMLTYFADLMAGYNYLVSYNGDTFDIPYMRTKFSQFDIGHDMDRLQSVDIFRVTRRYKKLLGLSGAKQIDIENLIHFDRRAFISGGALISAYRSYIKHSEGVESDRLLTDMLTHNHDDIRGLIAITGFLQLENVTRGLTLTGISEDSSNVTYTCSIPPLPCNISGDYRNVSLIAHGIQLTLNVPKISGVMRYYFKDYRNYFYLPVEQTVIHKSLAAYVDSEHKQRATRDNAFSAKSSVFVACPCGYTADIFYDTDYRGDRYVELSSELLHVCDKSESYVRCVINQIFPKRKNENNT